MAKKQHVDILKQGVKKWDQWRKKHPDIRPDLGGANLSRADLSDVGLWGANLRGADLSDATLSRADFRRADLSDATLRKADFRKALLSDAYFSRANLSGANLSGAYLKDANLIDATLNDATLRGADLRGAILRKATLIDADLRGADLSGADLSGADLRFAIFIQTHLHKATLTNCRVDGIAIWDVDVSEVAQSGLVIADPSSKQPSIAVDNLKMAQFIYLFLNNKEIREVIDTITSKVVLIVGRFTSERKAVLEALKEALRTHNYAPILFNFAEPGSGDCTETVRTLARLARFIIVDLTEPSSIPQTLQTILPTFTVPVHPVLFEGKREDALFADFKTYPYLLPIHHYTDPAHLLASLQEHVIAPVEHSIKPGTREG